MRLCNKTVCYGVMIAGAATLLGGCNREGEFSPVDMWNRSRYKPLEESPVFESGSSSRPLPPGTVYRGQTARDALYPPGTYSGTYYGSFDSNSSEVNESRPGEGQIGAATPDGTGTATGAAQNRGGGATAGTGAAGGATGGGATGGGATGGGATGGAAAGGATGGRTAAAGTTVGGVNIPRQTGETDPIFLGPGANVTTFPIKVDAQVMRRGQVQYEVFCMPCHARTGYGNGMIVQRGFAQPPSFHSDRLRGAPVGHYFEVITNGYGAMYSYASRVEPEDRWAIVAYIRALQLSQNPTMAGVPPAEQKQLRNMPIPEGLMPNTLEFPSVINSGATNTQTGR